MWENDYHANCPVEAGGDQGALSRVSNKLHVLQKTDPVLPFYAFTMVLVNNFAKVLTDKCSWFSTTVKLCPRNYQASPRSQLEVPNQV